MISATSCTRCGGFIVPEAFRDIGVSTVGWHCLLCGETVDAVILQNRARPYATSLVDEDPAEWLPAEDDGEFQAKNVGWEEPVLD